MFINQKAKKFTLLTCLYLAQGIPFGFFLQTLPSLLRQEGMGLETIALGSLLALPWALKWLWAPLVDKSNAHRAWILVANTLSIMLCLLLSQMDLQWLIKQQLWLLYLSFFLFNLSAASQDIAADATAVKLLTIQERGLGNGIQVAGYRFGMVLSGGLLLSLFSSLGWSLSLQILALLLLIPTAIAVTLMKKPVKTQINTYTFSWLSIIRAYRSRYYLIWFSTLCCYKFGDALAAPMLRPMLIDKGFSIEALAWIVGTLGFSAGLLGALVGGLLINILGHRKALVGFLCANSIVIASYGLYDLALMNAGFIIGLVTLEHFIGGMATVALFTEMMYHCRAHYEASDYTFQASLVVIVTIIAGSLSGFIVNSIGYGYFFLLCAALVLLALPMVLFYQHCKTKAYEG